MKKKIRGLIEFLFPEKVYKPEDIKISVHEIEYFNRFNILK